MFKRIWPYVRVVLSLALLAFALSRIDWLTLSHSKHNIHMEWVVFAVIALIGNNILAGLRWAWLMRAAGFNEPLKTYVALYFSGGLINQGLPTTIGGDSYRAIQAIRGCKISVSETNRVNMLNAQPRLRQSLLIVAMERSLGLLGNNIAGALGLLIGGGVIGHWAVQFGGLLMVCMLGGAALLALLLRLPVSLNYLSQLLKRFHLEGALPAIKLGFGWPYCLVQIVLAVVIHFVAIMALWFCLSAFGATPPIESLMIGLPALVLLMMLPISISGWGLRETTLSAVLALWGTDPSLTILGSVCYGAITLVSLLPGAYYLMRSEPANAINLETAIDR